MRGLRPAINQFLDDNNIYDLKFNLNRDLTSLQKAIDAYKTQHGIIDSSLDDAWVTFAIRTLIVLRKSVRNKQIKQEHSITPAQRRRHLPPRSSQRNPSQRLLVLHLPCLPAPFRYGVVIPIESFTHKLS